MSLRFALGTAAVAVALTAACARPSAAETIYFLVAEQPGSAAHHDSYVLPLSQSGDMDHARALIQDGVSAGAPIVVAQIAKGGDGSNGDYREPGLWLWSWHVEQFHGFADMTAEILDGWPGFVEQDVDGWISNTGAKIGFWSYTVVSEFGPNPPSIPEPCSLFVLGISAAGAGMAARLRAVRR